MNYVLGLKKGVLEEMSYYRYRNILKSEKLQFQSNKVLAYTIIIICDTMLAVVCTFNTYLFTLHISVFIIYVWYGVYLKVKIYQEIYAALHNIFSKSKELMKAKSKYLQIIGNIP